MNKQNLILVFCLLGMASLFAQNGREIMLLVENRPEAVDEQSLLTMTLTDKRGRSRQRELKLYSLNQEGLDYSLMLFTSPADVAGVSMLSMEQEEGDTDQWLYMPALGRTRRIASSSKDDSFMGSDFSYEDLEARNVDKDSHQLLGEESLQGRNCWKVESTPQEESAYGKRISWIDQEYLIPLKVEFFDQEGTLWKELRAEDIQDRQGYWTPMKMTMSDLLKEQNTVLSWQEVVMDQGLSPQFFSMGNLEGGLK